MTVEELIEELQRMPNKRVPVLASTDVRDGWSSHTVKAGADRAAFTGNAVVIEGK